MIEKMRRQFDHMLRQKLGAIKEEISEEDGGGFFSEL